MKYWELFYKLSRYWITVKQWSDTVKWHSISIDSYEKYNVENNYRMRGLCKCYGLQRNDLHEARWKSTSTQLSQCQFKLLESDPEQFIFDTCKHSTTLIKKFLVTIITAKLRDDFFETPLQSTNLMQIPAPSSIRMGSVDRGPMLSIRV